ncbi:ABC transporter [Thalassotalea insulae]|uniref:ABC transporter n=1 Tax=Thalassotalea insulae TaxID=2056778 RepID=A0ABQ6GT18_9GAMM|nr:ABC transporter ATP-binding protein [Thalassotalea insulae]GLX77807.1 ABC transporter [Thalassotalea insulae]
MKTLLTVSNLSVQLQQKAILDAIDLTLAQGDILGLVGPSGCGKTTLLNTIAGFVEHSCGQIQLAEQVIASEQYAMPAEQRRIGMIFQDYALFPHLTVAQNIAFGISHLPKKEQQQRIEQLLTLLQLSEYPKRYPYQLSGGQQQRVAIARALAPQPKLLLLDEPFSNIDARLRNELMLELRSLLKQLKMTAIFVTHNKDEVFTFADKIAVMDQGKLLQAGTPSDVFQQPDSWQVADFLQIGSWLPLDYHQQQWRSALGPIDDNSIVSLNSDNGHSDAQHYLLVKPKAIVVIPDAQANAKISYVSITGQGYHYLLSSINKDPLLVFEHLSFYSEQQYQQGQELALAIIPHQYQIFTR